MKRSTFNFLLNHLREFMSLMEWPFRHTVFASLRVSMFPLRSHPRFTFIDRLTGSKCFGLTHAGWQQIWSGSSPTGKSPLCRKYENRWASMVSHLFSGAPSLKPIVPYPLPFTGPIHNQHPVFGSGMILELNRARLED